jgi:tRNA uridine 5-carbamoylmethylation protein Kti12
MKNLILIRGVPGAGKTTLLRSLDDYVCVAADDYHTDEKGNYTWKPRFAQMTQEEQIEVARNFNNVYGETHMKLMVIDLKLNYINFFLQLSKC